MEKASVRILHEREAVAVNGVPIIICHEGRQPYLQECINQAKRFNNTVILVGDESNKDMGSDYWFNMADLETDEWRNFTELFCNMSTNPEKFELQCFKRFFAIYALMKKDIINECIHIDSDVLCYFDFSLFKEFTGRYMVSLGIPRKQDRYRWGAGAMTSYWTKEGITSFCDFVASTYKDNRMLLAEKWDYQKRNNLPGGICDMTLLYLWSRQYDGTKILNTMEQFEIGQNKVVIDNNINSIESCSGDKYVYDKLFNVKKIIFVNGLPYLQKDDGTRIRTLVLHFQGGAKRYMKFYAGACKHGKPFYYLLATAIKCKRLLFDYGKRYRKRGIVK